MTGFLPENIAHFSRALRVAGVPIGPAMVVDAIQAVEAAGISSRADFYWTLHSVMVKRKDHSVLFDQAFQIYWKKRGLMEKLMALMMPIAPTQQKKPDHASLRMQEAFFKNGEVRENEKPQLDIDARFTVSDAEVLQTKDFAQMTAAEIAEAKQRIKALVLPLNAVPVRRFEVNARGRAIDMRRTLRASLTGGLIALARKAHREEHPPLVMLLDISGSMSDYSRILLHFAHALMEKRPHVQVFTFGTRLTNITRALKTKDVDVALQSVSAHVADWSGGTRIAPSLHAFNKYWSRRVLAGGAVVMLVTDGLERDGTDSLAKEADRLHRSCRRLIWLNPLLRFDGFEARAAGIRALLPHVDEFRTIHNVKAVADLIAALDARRPDPRHNPRNYQGVADDTAG